MNGGLIARAFQLSYPATTPSGWQPYSKSITVDYTAWPGGLRQALKTLSILCRRLF
jgi:hypothetical protein